MCLRSPPPSPSSAPPSASSCHDLHARSSLRSRGAWCARIFPWTYPATSKASCSYDRNNVTEATTGDFNHVLLLDDGLGDVRRDLHVLRKFHREGRSPLAHGPH